MSAPRGINGIHTLSESSRGRLSICRNLPQLHAG